MDSFSILKKETVIDLSFAKLFYYQEIDLLEVEYQENTLIDRKEALMVINASRVFNNGANKYTMITATKEFFNMTPEARATFAEEMKTGFKTEKMALYVNSLAYRIMANFFIRFDKPPIPTRLFSNRDKAIDWLLS
jgi:predicted DNA binding protein